MRILGGFAWSLPQLIIAEFQGGWWNEQAYNRAAFDFITGVRKQYPTMRVLGVIALNDPELPQAQQAVAADLIHGLLSKPWGLPDLQAAVESIRRT